MKIKNIYVGGWFQRTMLQLSEIYDFLRGVDPKLKLSKQKLATYRQALDINSIEYGINGEEFIRFTTNNGVNVKIFEDGLIVLSYGTVNSDALIEDMSKIQTYYESSLSPALNYLFSLGAPVPKELAGIENVYPYFIVLDKATKAEMQELLTRTEGQRYFEFETPK